MRESRSQHRTAWHHSGSTAYCARPVAPLPNCSTGLLTRETCCRLPRFTAGLLKVVAATETLAAGINMPARTTVIGSLSRRQNVGHVLLKHNQLLQMAGRAGRRGFDIAGAALPRPPDDAPKIAGLAHASMQPHNVLVAARILHVLFGSVGFRQLPRDSLCF
jgi:Helicase conserved C-terminal domain